MIKKCLFSLLLFFLFSLIYAEDLYIDGIHFTINGVTNRNSLLRVAQLSEGQRFASVKKLENALEIAKDNLVDTRLFEMVQVDYELLPPTQDGAQPVKVHLVIEDSWNLIALPYPKYDSNDGFEFSLRARDYNFLGLMEPLRLNLNYSFDENQKHNYEVELDYTVNFPIMDHSFHLDFSQSFKYSPDDSYGDDFYMNSGLSFGTSWLLPWDIYEGNKIGYNISTSIGRDYIPWDRISTERDEVNLGFSHGFSLGHISWGENNFREGITYSLENSWSLDIDDNDNRVFNDSWSTSISGNTSFFRDMYPLGYSGRIGFFQNLRGDAEDAEEPFRGIKSMDDIEAEGYIYMNNGLYITVWNNENFWEIMGGPCLDLGYRWGIPEDNENQDSILWSIALDGLCYPSFAKSFQARITIGMSGNGFMASSADVLTRVKNNLEMFFGLGMFF